MIRSFKGLDFLTPPANLNNKQITQTNQRSQNPQSRFQVANNDRDRGNLRGAGYKLNTEFKDELDGSNRGRNMSEDFFVKKENSQQVQSQQAGGPQKNFARNIKQTLNFNSDDPQKLLEREMQKIRWQEELAMQMEMKKNMKMDELKKLRMEAEREEQRVMREREDLNKMYLQQIEREERQFKGMIYYTRKF
jgi:hypothetical protein